METADSDLSKGYTVGSEIRTNIIQPNKVLLSRELIAASLMKSLAEIWDQLDIKNR